jgi:hypothetical protein
MRENRTYGSEGGGTETNRFSLPLSKCVQNDCLQYRVLNWRFSLRPLCLEIFTTRLRIILDRLLPEVRRQTL